MQSVIAPVGILGFGVEGQSSLQYLLSMGIKDIVIMDKNPIDSNLLGGAASALIFTGDNYLDGLKECVTVIRSAGVYPMMPELLTFQMNGGLLTSQVEIYFQETKVKKIIGVTGTLGKGSCVSMIAHVLKAVGMPSEIGGNFGVPALDLLKTDSPDRVAILELSSFQLMTLAHSPEIAVVLNVTSEHLDWHRSVEEYRDAKANIVRYQKASDCCIYFNDSVHATEVAKQSKALALSFGHGNFDASIIGETLHVSDATLALSECGIRGAYQLENMAAAALACKALGVFGDESLQALKTYEPLRFRMEFKGEVKGIEFFNDSYATRPDATIAAAKSMKRPFSLVLGGSEKDADFKELAASLATLPLLKKVGLIGDTALRLKQELHEANVSVLVTIFPSLKDAFTEAVKIGAGGALLFSPACASFGLFKNYKARGEAFDALVDDFN